MTRAGPNRANCPALASWEGSVALVFIPGVVRRVDRIVVLAVVVTGVYGFPEMGPL